jgi:hypothetical protein
MIFRIAETGFRSQNLGSRGDFFVPVLDPGADLPVPILNFAL